MTSAGLLSACRIPEQAWISFCNGYMQAAADAVSSTGRAYVPADTTRTALVPLFEVRVVELFEESEQYSEAPAFVLAGVVIASQYPCNEQ